MGFAGLAHVLAMTKAPTSPADVTATIGLSFKRASGVLRQFWVMGLVHRVGWIKPKHGFPTPIYQIGKGEDMPAMIGAEGRPHAYADMRPKVMEPRVVAFASVIQSMELPIGVEDLVHQSGVGTSRLRELLKVLRQSDISLVYIAGYSQRPDKSGAPMALWCYGIDKRNAPRPKKPPRIRNRRKADLVRPQWANTVMDLRRGAGINRPKVAMAESVA
jgi:hypothetical protein